MGNLTRNEKILFRINTACPGLEIGPGYQPVLKKSSGYNVKTIDFLDKEGLIKKFAADNLDTSGVEDVDYIWCGEPLYELTGHEYQYNYVIASHLIEHTPDFIGFLNDVSRLLTSDGVLSLVIPDKRYCFDHFRPLTGLSQIIDAHFQKRTLHSPGTGAEHFLSYVSGNGQPGWGNASRVTYQLRHTIEETIHLINEIREKDTYFDLHAWCFTPKSFTFLMGCLAELKLIDLYLDTIFPTTGIEFFVTLSKRKPDRPFDRLAAMQAMETKTESTIEPGVKQCFFELLKSLQRKLKRFTG